MDDRLPSSADSLTEFRAWFAGSRVVGQGGRPLVVYCADGGLPGRQGSGPRIFHDLDGARESARDPAGRKPDGSVHVVPVHLALRRPLIADPDQAWVDFGRISELLGRERTREIAQSLASEIEASAAWHEEWAGEFDHLSQVIDRDPERLDILAVPVTAVLESAQWRQWLAEAGCDGSIHATQRDRLIPTYQVFEDRQIRSALGLNSGFDQAPSVPAGPYPRVEGHSAPADYIRNRDGTPQVFYRGETSGELYTRFDARKTNEKVGFFFAEGIDHAALYGQAGKAAPRAFLIRSERLIDLTDPYAASCRGFLRAYAREFDDWTDRISGEPRSVEEFLEGGDLYHYEGWGAERWHHLFRFAGRNGYDAVRVRDCTDGVPMSTVLVAIHENQIEFAPTGFTQAPKESSPAFQKWFLGSAIRDETGAPQIVYHGTAGDFDTFSKAKAQDRDGRRLGLGWGKGKFYFTRNPESAGIAAKAAEIRGQGDRPNVVPVYLKVTRPVLAERYLGQVEREVAKGRTRDQAIAAVDRKLKRLGYDGIIDPTSGGFAVFEPGQIKSALGNFGGYSPESASIVMSSAPGPDFQAWFEGSQVIDERGQPKRLYHGTHAPADFESFNHSRHDLGSHFGGSEQANDRLDNLAMPGVEPGPARLIPVFLSIRNPLRLPDLGEWTVDSLTSPLVELFPEDRVEIANLLSSEQIRDFLADKGFDGVVYRNTNEGPGSEPHRRAVDQAWEALKAARRTRGAPEELGTLDEAGSPEFRAFTDARAAYAAHREKTAEDSFIAFWPEQVKSAIGNRGTFNPEDPSILASSQGSPEFERWFGNSKAVRSDGKPLVVYHGTTADFESFDPHRRHREGHIGQGFYFSSSTVDVAENYAGLGADLQAKIASQSEKVAESMLDELRHADLSIEDIARAAKAEVGSWYLKHEGLTIPVYLSLQNPAVIGGDDQTLLSVKENPDRPGSLTGSLVDFTGALRSASASFFGGDLDETITRLMQACQERGDSIPLSDVVDLLFDDDAMERWFDDDGYHADREMIRRALETMGFDGIIDRTVHRMFGERTPRGTTHYIAFKSQQIKSAIGNAGAFDPSDTSILRSAQEDAAVLRDTAGRPKVFFTGSIGKGFHSANSAIAQEMGQRELPFDLMVERPSETSAPSLVSNLRNPLLVDWTNDRGEPQAANQPSQGFLNLHDAARSAALKGHDGLIVHGLEGSTKSGRPFGPVSYVPLSPRQVRQVNDDPAALLKRQINASMRRAQRDPTIAGLLGNVGPFDGGCLIVAKALIVVAQRGELVRIDSEHGPEHYGARIDGRIFDFAGSHGSESSWIANFQRREWATSRRKVLKVEVGLKESEIPDRPETSLRIAKRLMELGRTFESVPSTDARFSAWFGNSQITTALGTPRVVFHGSGAPGFVRFNPDLRGTSSPTADSKEGFFFAANPRSAEQFTWRDGEKRGAIYPVYLRIERPLIVSDLVLDGSRSQEVAERIRSAQAHGHDGVIFAHSDMLGHPGEVYVAFEPEQIKSAIGNVGSFDPHSANILRSSQRHFELWFGESKVVDEHGGPQVVYHGTRAGPFRIFDTTGEGAHFGSREQALSRASLHRDDGNARLIPVYLSIQNPLDLPDLGTWDRFQTVFTHLSVTGVLARDEADRVWAQWQKGDGEGWTSLKAAIKAKGFDGIRYLNEVEGRGASFIAFDAHQIKSADANVGLYSAQDPSIYASSQEPAIAFDVRPQVVNTTRPLALGPQTAPGLAAVAAELARRRLINNAQAWHLKLQADATSAGLQPLAEMEGRTLTRLDLEQAGYPRELQLQLIEDAQTALLRSRLLELGFDGISYQDEASGTEAYVDLERPEITVGFTQWFGNSQLVSADGRPLVLFHGTDASFEAFDLDRVGQRTDDGALGQGFYFSTDPRVPDDKAVCMPVHVRAERPLFLEMPDFHTDKRSLVRASLNLEPDADGPSIRGALLEAGYDSVVLDYSPTGYAHREVMALHPGQIKSAIGNAGLFSRENNSILASTPTSPRKRSEITVEANGRMFEARVGKKVVGRAYPWEDSRGKFVMMDVAVSAPFRRRGVGRALYEAVEKAFGRPLEPAVSLSDDGFEFWKRFRPQAVAHDLRHRKDQLIGQAIWWRDQPGIIEQAVGRVAIVRNDNGTTRCLHAEDIDAAIEAAVQRQVPVATQSIAFQAWFRNSQVTRGDGSPLVVYHGSRVPYLERFDPKMEGTGAVNTQSKRLGGFWFTTSRSNAAFFADARDPVPAERDTILPYGESSTGFYAAVEDRNGERLFEVGPYSLREEAQIAAERAVDDYNAQPDRGDAITEVYLSLQNPLVLEGVIPREAEFAAARAGGHDGIIARGVVDGAEHGDVFVAFDSTQIKSATQNSGRFDPEDPAIRMSAAPQRAFQDWFGRSPVTDAAGRPLVLYHGSALEGLNQTTDITAFDRARTGDRFQADDRGFFFSNDPEIASEYARSDRDIAQPGAGAGVVYPVFVNLQKPLVVDEGFLQKQGMSPIGRDLDTISFWDVHQDLIKRWAKKAGADGVILRDAVKQVGGSPVQTVIAFRPEQIKSAIGNCGTFDRHAPSILMSTARVAEPVVSPLERFLSSSRVVDGQGRPLRVYHGTNQNFDVFSSERLGANTGTISATAFFFTESPAEADEYAGMSARRQVSNAQEAQANAERLLGEIDRAYARGEFAKGEALTLELEESEREAITGEERGANVLPVYLSITNPKVIDFKGSIDHVLLSVEIERARAQGHDGLRLDNVFDAVTDRPEPFLTRQWIAFHPEQIKSALGNRGSFDHRESSILLSSGPTDGAGNGGRRRAYRATDARGRPTGRHAFSSAAAAERNSRGLEGSVSAVEPIAPDETVSKRARLPLGEGGLVRVEGSAEGLANFLSPVNDPRITARIGRETVVRRTETLIKTVGEVYRTRDGSLMGGRYLALDAQGDIIGALNFTIRGRASVVSNLYVHANHRRQGVASRLVEWARSDMPRIATDGAMTADGAAFMGYEPTIRLSTAAPSLDQWMGQSVLRGPDGEPIRLFHGTNRPPEVFSEKRQGAVSTIFGTEHVERHGIFMTPDPDLSANFAQAHGDHGAAVMPLYARIERPLDMTVGYTDELFNRVWTWGNRQGLDGYRVARYLGDHWGEWMLFDADGLNEPDLVVRMIRDLGYDGVKLIEPAVPGERPAGETYVAFEPGQVKSAIGNIGKFDPANPSILASSLPHDSDSPSAFKAWFGASKVLDGDGKPLVVYHGGSKVEVFDKARSADGGFYFVADPDEAAAFARLRGKSSVNPVYLRIEKNGFHRLREILKEGGLNYSGAYQRLVSEGYDGVFTPDDPESGELIVFSPDQIRSALPSPTVHLGRVIPGPEAEARSLNSWFRQSKVATAEGKPQIVYHGTKDSFEIFAKGENRMSMRAEAGFWFSTEPADAGRYGSLTMPVMLSIQKPLRITQRQLDFIAQERPMKQTVEMWKRQGFDGLYIQPIKADPALDEKEQPAQWVAFDPDQIKSAIGNRGTYDPANPSILASSRADPAESAAAPAGRVASNPFFQAWFGASRVRSADGAPQVVFHAGTFDEFEEPIPVISDDGFHFGTKNAALERDGGKRVDDFIQGLRIESTPNEEGERAWFWSSEGIDSADLRPEGFASEQAARQDAERYVQGMDFSMDEPLPLTAAYLSIANPKRVEDQVNDWSQVIAAAKAEGHDGLVYRNSFEDKGSDSWIAFYPWQVKSIRNAGSFLREDPSVLRSSGPVDRDPTPFDRWFAGSRITTSKGEPLKVFHGTADSFEVFQSKAYVGVYRADDEEILRADAWDMGADGLGQPDRYHYMALGDAAQLGAAQAYQMRRSEALRHRPDGDFSPDTARMLRDLERLQGKAVTATTERRPTKDGFYFTPSQSYSYVRDIGRQAGGHVVPVYLSIKNPVFLNASQIETAGMAAQIERYQQQGYDGAVFANDPSDLEKHGIGGATQIVAFSPTQIKSALGNRGTFDPEDPSILASQAKARLSSTTLSDLIAGHPQERCAARRWREMLPTWRGIDIDALAWSGLDAWLREVDRCTRVPAAARTPAEIEMIRRHPNGEVTRDELLNYLELEDLHFHPADGPAGDPQRFQMSYCEGGRSARLERMIERAWKAVQCEVGFPIEGDPAAQVRWAQVHAPDRHEVWQRLINEQLHALPRSMISSERSGNRLVAMELLGRQVQGVLELTQIQAHEGSHADVPLDPAKVEIALRQALHWAADHGCHRVHIAAAIGTLIRDQGALLRTFAEQWGGTVGLDTTGALSVSVTPSMVQSARTRRPLYQMKSRLMAQSPECVPGTARPDVLVSPAIQVAEQRLAAQGIHVSLDWGDGRDVRGLAKVAQAFGRRLVPYRIRSATQDLNGFVLPDDPKTVYVNLHSRFALRAIIGHELSHSIFMKDRKGYERLMTIARRHHVGPSPLTEETLCDFIGRKFTDARFMLAVEREKPSLLQKLVAGAKAVLGKVQNVMRKAPDLYQAHEIRDCVEMREAAAALLRTHLKAPAMAPQQTPSKPSPVLTSNRREPAPEPP